MTAPMRQTTVKGGRRGIALIWVAITGIVFIGLIGLALDAGYGLLTGHQLQNAADAAALAGAMVVRADSTQAQQKATQFGLANAAAGDPVQLSFDDIRTGRWQRPTGPFTPDSDANFRPPPNAVEVTASRTDTSAGGPLPLLFGPAFGVDTVNVSRSATAIIAGTTGGGMIMLCPDCECALEFDGTTGLVLESAPGHDGDTAIQINSDDGCAVCGGGNFTLVAPETNIVGEDPGACWNGNPTVDTYVNPDSPEIPDPLADLPPPPCNGDTFYEDQINKTGEEWNPPGNYPDGIVLINSGHTVNLLPGVYCVDGEGLYVKGGTLTAHGVMFYVIDSTPWDNKHSTVNLVGNAYTDITPSDDENDPYWGISIFQARDNTNEATIIGTSDMNLDGTLYFPVAPLELGGTGISLGTQLIAWTTHVHGTGTFTIAYDGRFPATGAKVFLVQ